ncbi:MAG: glycosyltransferase family 4 protein [Rubrobacteraceae bacterium]
MRLAFITVGDTGRKTGGYLYNARVCGGLREKGVEVEEISACDTSPEEQRTAAPHFGSGFDARDYDVLVVDALACVVCAPHLERWRETTPVVAMVHELPSIAGSGSPDYEEPLLRSDRVVTVSGHGRSLLENRVLSGERIDVVPPGFDRLRVGGSESQTSHQDGTIRALCVAQWIPRKDIIALVEAWTLRERQGTTLELIGETDADLEYAASVWSAIEAASGHSIRVAGTVDDAALRGAYATADFFVLPSQYEGYGVVYAEALANGLPVIACEVGPVPELVGKAAARLVPPGDVATLDRALTLLLENPDLRARMSAAAYRRAEELPRWNETIEGFHEVLLAAVGERGRVA